MSADNPQPGDVRVTPDGTRLVFAAGVWCRAFHPIVGDTSPILTWTPLVAPARDEASTVDAHPGGGG